jgi:hypothetical protein
MVRKGSEGRRAIKIIFMTMREGKGWGELGGLESLHRYNPHFTDGFLIIESLQSRNGEVTGRYG